MPLHRKILKFKLIQTVTGQLILNCPVTAGVLRRNWQISVLCQFSIFLSISVLFMPFHVPKSVQHNKFNRLKLLHHKFCEIQILG